MRRTMLVGVVLALAAVAVVVLDDYADLELESMILFGIALGAVVALVPDRSLVERGAGFAIGVVVALCGYFLRAGLMPDSTSGRAVELALVVLVCTAFAALSRGHLPLWSTLLGAAAMWGSYEYVYDAAPPEVVSTSLSAVMSLFITVAVGFVAAAVAAPRTLAYDGGTDARAGAGEPDLQTLERQMETSK